MTTLISACDLAHTREARSPLRLTTLETQAGVFRFAGIRANAAGPTTLIRGAYVCKFVCKRRRNLMQ